MKIKTRILLFCFLIFFITSVTSAASSADRICLMLTNQQAHGQIEKGSYEYRTLYRLIQKTLTKDPLLSYYNSFKILDKNIRLDLLKVYSQFFLEQNKSSSFKVQIPERIFRSLQKVAPQKFGLKKEVSKKEMESLLVGIHFNLVVSFVLRFEKITSQGGVNNWEDSLQSSLMGLMVAFHDYADIIITSKTVQGKDERPSFTSVAWNRMMTAASEHNFISLYVYIPTPYLWPLKKMERIYLKLKKDKKETSPSRVIQVYIQENPETFLHLKEGTLEELWTYYVNELNPPIGFDSHNLAVEFLSPQKIYLQNERTAERSFISDQTKQKILEALDAFIPDDRQYHVVIMSLGLYGESLEPFTEQQISDEIFRLSQRGLLPWPDHSQKRSPLSLSRVQQLISKGYRSLRTNSQLVSDDFGVGGLGGGRFTRNQGPDFFDKVMLIEFLRRAGYEYGDKLPFFLDPKGKRQPMLKIFNDYWR